MSEVAGPAPLRGRVDVVVAAMVPDLSRSQATRLVREGAVMVEGRVVDRPKVVIDAGDQVVVRVPPPAPSEVVAQDLPIDIVFEDPDVVVVNKAPGMVVHPGAGHPDGTLVNALLHHVHDLSGIGGVERPGIVHRLDRGTSGLLVVAKHDVAHRHLAAQFAAHTARRTYLAICAGVPSETSGTLHSWLARHPKDRVRFASCAPDRGKEAITHWWLEHHARGVSVVRCELETGRTHQIRVHLTEHGLPLLGDPLYKRRQQGTPSWLADVVAPDRPLLHARALRFVHPRSGEEVSFEAAPPADFAGVLARITA